MIDAVVSWVREHGWQTYIGLCLLLWGVLITADSVWALALPHWPMGLVMIGGSLVAGSTPMGGGTIAFPALVLGFHESPVMARDFGLAIQSIGMTSALLFIVKRGIPVEKRMLLWSCVGAAAGLTLGTYLLAGRVPGDWVKLLFATLWITFGAWLVTGTAKATSEPRPSTDGTNVVAFGLAVGLVGGAVASLIGVGVEMLVYATLVLRFGWGPKAAVPTAVCATALVSPIGMALRAATAGVHPAVFPTWMACVPIVIFGAPAGAYISTRMPRSVLLRIIGLLVLVQFAVTVNQVRPSLEMWGGVLALAAVSGLGLWMLAPGRDDTVTEPGGLALSLVATFNEPEPRVERDSSTLMPPGFEPSLAIAERERAASPPSPLPVVPSMPPVSVFPLPANERAAVTVDAKVPGVRLSHVHELGITVHPLGSIAAGMNRREWLLRHAQSIGLLDAALDGAESPLAVLHAAREEATRLLSALNTLAMLPAVEIGADEARVVKAAHRDFERAFHRALHDERVFRVPRLGIYDTALLMNEADQMFAAGELDQLSARARAEWRAAGRCLAMRLGTACVFHAVRTAEAVLHDHPNRALDPRLVELINHIRGHHWNPVGHTGLTVDASQAYALFNLTHTAIVEFLTAQPAPASLAERKWV